MKKPKKGDIVIAPDDFIWPHLPSHPREFKVLEIGEYGYFIETPLLSSGRYYIGFYDNWQIKEPDPTEYMPIISLVLAILIVLLLIFSSFYFKL